MNARYPCVLIGGCWIEAAAGPECRVSCYTRFPELNPFQFIQEVRAEVSKVTWPTRKETWVTTIAVLIMVTIAALFFMVVDQILGYIVTLVLGR
ncbi:MAG: preprotein translocase subunit SecE [Pseudomonadota bacterium]